MKQFTKRHINSIVMVLLSGLFLYFAFRSLDLGKVPGSLLNYNFWWIIPVTLLVLLSIVLRALRWKLILKPIKTVKTHLLFEAIMLSYFTNLLLPINIGELVRAYLIKKKVRISMSAVLGSIAIERIMSMIGFILVGILALSLISIPAEISEIRGKAVRGLLIAAAAVGGLILLVILSKKFRSRIVPWLKLRLKKINKKHHEVISRVVDNFIQGLQFGNSKKDITAIVIYSILIRISYGILTLFIAKGFGIDLPLITFLFIDIVVTFAHTIGVHIFGIIGTYEAAMTYALALFGVAKETALSVALIADATFIVPSLILGAIYFIKEGLSFSKLKKLHK